MEQSARGGEGRGAGPNPCVGEGRCALVDWPDAGRNEPVMLVESPSSPRLPSWTHALEHVPVCFLVV